MNLVLSDRVHGDSKIIFERDPRARVEKVAPWLTTDSKTYPAVVDGQRQVDRRRLHHPERPALHRADVAHGDHR